MASEEDPVLRELKKIRKEQKKMAGNIFMCVVYSGAALMFIWLIYQSMDFEEE